jgi:hypothetical protein
MSLDEDLDAQLAVEPDFADVDVLVNGKLRRLRFTSMDGLAWADLTDKAPPRPTAALDRAYGFNIRLVVALAVPICGRLVDGGDLVELTDEQWKKLLRGLKGAQQRAIGDALFDLNVWGPSKDVDAARKAFEAGSGKNSSSPEL